MLLQMWQKIWLAYLIYILAMNMPASLGMASGGY